MKSDKSGPSKNKFLQTDGGFQFIYSENSDESFQFQAKHLLSLRCFII